MGIEQKRWACAANLTCVLPNLESIVVQNDKVVLADLVQRVPHLSAHALNLRTIIDMYGSNKAPETTQDRQSGKRSRTPSPKHSRGYTSTLSRMVKSRAAVQLVAAAYTIRHSVILTTVDLSGVRATSDQTCAACESLVLVTCMRVEDETCVAVAVVCERRPAHLDGGRVAT